MFVNISPNLLRDYEKYQKYDRH